MPTNEHELASLTAFRIAHLQMIQAIISRMNAASLGIKGFCIAATGAFLALKDLGSDGRFLWLSGLVLILAICDANYLRLETDFRRLYRNVAKRPLAQSADMAVERPHPSVNGFLSSVGSWSVALFYGSMVAMAVLAFLLKL